MAETEWYKHTYRRHLLDMHYDDWNDEFLSEFDTKAIVETLKKARVKSNVVFANSHTGLCYWPAKTGRMHGALKGRDIVGEFTDLLHKEGMYAILYLSFIYDNWVYDNNPSWRILDRNGKASRECIEKRVVINGVDSFLSGHRYGLCCPNSGYRDFAVARIQDLCSRYDAEGIYLDMLFWPAVCYCPNCQERYHNETGRKIPKVVNWKNQEWLDFQKKREDWMTEFADLLYQTVKSVKPGMSAAIQSSLAIQPWLFGCVESELGNSDYTFGDFYGGPLEESFACKLFYNLTPNPLFEYEAFFILPDLSEHTVRKKRETMEINTFTALAHNGAFLLIEPIDPKGRIQNAKMYEEMGKIFGRVEAYEPYVGGELCQDVGIYFSMRSKMNYLNDARNSSGYDLRQPHLEAAKNAMITLRDNHIPVGVINRNMLHDLSKFKVIILPDVYFMDSNEVEAIRRYVDDGGRLYASGYTSLGQLDDVFGIVTEGETEENLTYIGTRGKNASFMPETLSGYPLTIRGRQVKAKPVNADEVMAYIVLPYTNPEAPGKFASIHSNPPGPLTDYPSVIYRKYGRGEVIWTAVAIERTEYPPHKEIFIGLVKKLLGDAPSFSADIPEAVEVTLFHQTDNRRYIINLINLQDHLPPIPLYNMKVKVRLGDSMPVGASILPHCEAVPVKKEGNYAAITVPILNVFQMLALDYI